ncbi:MAG: hypothetical protein DMF89_25690 [Acidobacteria bacterium]|nr:MAG: hypothetical protein DMF89_25690 [Acidobacteriota bacterium]
MDQVRLSRPRHTSQGFSVLVTLSLSRFDGEVVEQTYLGHQFETNAVRAEFDSALERARIVPPLGRPVTLVPEANLVLVAFPNDRRMNLMTERDLRAWLAARANDLPIDGCPAQGRTLTEARIQILRYVPGQRLTLRARGFIEGEHEARYPFAFIAKQFRKKKQARELFNNLRAVAAHLASSPVGAVPRPIACDEDLGMVLMEELCGSDLEQALPSLEVRTAMHEVGQLLAALHRVPLPVPGTLSSQEHLADIRASCEVVREALPAAAPQLERCLTMCVTGGWGDEVPAVVLHGACRPKHVLVHEGKLAFVDLDGMRMGHPAYDLGHFLSALYYLEDGDRFDATVRSICSRCFIEGYLAGVPWKLSPAIVLRHVAALLIHKQARKYVLHMDDHPEQKVDRVLGLAEAALVCASQLGEHAPFDAIWRVLD